MILRRVKKEEGKKEQKESVKTLCMASSLYFSMCHFSSLLCHVTDWDDELDASQGQHHHSQHLDQVCVCGGVTSMPNLTNPWPPMHIEFCHIQILPQIRVRRENI